MLSDTLAPVGHAFAAAPPDAATSVYQPTLPTRVIVSPSRRSDRVDCGVEVATRVGVRVDVRVAVRVGVLVAVAAVPLSVIRKSERSSNVLTLAWFRRGKFQFSSS